MKAPGAKVNPDTIQLPPVAITDGCAAPLTLRTMLAPAGAVPDMVLSIAVTIPEITGWAV